MKVALLKYLWYTIILTLYEIGSINGITFIFTNQQILMGLVFLYVSDLL